MGWTPFYLLFYLFPMLRLRACQNLRCSDFSFRLAGSVSSFCQDSALFCLIELKTINVGFVLGSQIDFLSVSRYLDKLCLLMFSPSEDLRQLLADTKADQRIFSSRHVAFSSSSVKLLTETKLWWLFPLGPWGCAWGWEAWPVLSSCKQVEFFPGRTDVRGGFPQFSLWSVCSCFSDA